MHALLVEDEPHMQKALRITLANSGYFVSTCDSGEGAIDFVRRFVPDIVLLDLGLPDMDGKDVLRELRAFTVAPIIVLSARSEESEKVAAFDLGATDYVEKPAPVDELLARMRRALRDLREFTYADATGLKLDTRMRWVEKKGVRLKLSPSEYELLTILARSAGQTNAHEELMRAVWGEAHQKDVGQLRVLVRQLRAKIEDDPSCPRLILTEPGIGYRFDASPT